jgi:hypothetical protein
MVLGVDPGTTTGLAVIELDLSLQGRPRVVWTDQLAWEEAARQVERRMQLLNMALSEGVCTRAAVAPEKFTLNAQTAQRGQGPAEDAMGMLGVVRHYAAAYGVETGKMEQASAAKKLVGDDVLEGLRLYKKGQKHANDALRHAVLFAVKRGWMHGSWLTMHLYT